MAFISYWEKNRLRRKKTMRQFLLGIPAGLLIVVPIVINFSSGWYRRANMEANSEDFNPMVLFVALLLIVGFTAIFWQKHQWDQLEQLYRELLARQAKGTPQVLATVTATATPNADVALLPPVDAASPPVANSAQLPGAEGAPVSPGDAHSPFPAQAAPSPPAKKE